MHSFFPVQTRRAFFVLSSRSALQIPPFSSGPTWVRTRDLPVMSRWLFQLSYGPILIICYPPGVSTPSQFRIAELEFRLPAAGREFHSALHNPWPVQYGANFTGLQFAFDIMSRGNFSVFWLGWDVVISLTPLLRSDGFFPG
jgi:hypothetical protein